MEPWRHAVSGGNTRGGSHEEEAGGRAAAACGWALDLVELTL